MLDLVLQLVLLAIALIREEHQFKDSSISLRENIRPPDGAAQGQCEHFWLEVATWIGRAELGFVFVKYWCASSYSLCQ